MIQNDNGNAFYPKKQPKFLKRLIFILEKSDFFSFHFRVMAVFVKKLGRRVKKSSPSPPWGHCLPVTALALSAFRPYGPPRFTRGLHQLLSLLFFAWSLYILNSHTDNVFTGTTTTNMTTTKTRNTTTTTTKKKTLDWCLKTSPKCNVVNFQICCYLPECKRMQPQRCSRIENRRNGK